MIRLYNPNSLTIEYFDGAGRTIQVYDNVVRLYHGVEGRDPQIFRFPDGTPKRMIRLFMDSLAQIEDGMVDLVELLERVQDEYERQKTFRIDDWPKTRDEAKAKRYECSDWRSEGVPYYPDHCAAHEPYARGVLYQCMCSPGYGPDSLYCQRHAKMLAEANEQE